MTWKPWMALSLSVCTLALPARGQEPKVGDYYEDRTDLGFKVRVPLKWEPIPPSPEDGNLVIKYDPKTNKSIQIGKGERLSLSVWILKLDRRQGAQSQSKVRSAKDLAGWFDMMHMEGFEVASKKDLQVDKVAATECVYASRKMAEDKEEVRLYAMTYQLEPDVDVVFVGWGPGESKRWMKFESAFREMARSFRNLEVQATKTEVAAGASLRDRKRAELEDKISRTPGWKLYESPNYFIVSDNPDKAFLDELMSRLEAIRSLYEQDYPESKAKEIREAAALVRTGPAADDKRNDEEEEGSDEGKPPAKPEPEPDFAMSRELSRCSVVRVCKNAGEYHSYGGPPSAAGHWDSDAQELVVYDDRANGGKGDTWITLNHEAFHQYIFYFYGRIAPHSWYNEGTGDFYSGYMFKNGRFTLEKNPWRKDTIRKAIREEGTVPLADFMRWSQKDYYGGNSLGVQGGVSYAQGWSVIYFLRTGKKNNAKGWDPKWDDLLENYLRALATTRKPSTAIEQCLAGIDLDALQAAWLDYTK